MSKLKTCTKCNVPKSEVEFKSGSSWCKSCTAEYKKAWRRENKAKVKARKTKWSKDNSQHIKDYKRSYYENNSDLIKERARDWKQNNKTRVKEYKNLWYKTEIGKLLGLNKTKKRQSLILGLRSDLTNQQWLETLSEFNNQCAYCGSTIKLCQEHVIPVSKGGPYTKYNIIPGCESCNSHKSNTDMIVWYQEQEFFDLTRLDKILRFMEVNYNG